MYVRSYRVLSTLNYLGIFFLLAVGNAQATENRGRPLTPQVPPHFIANAGQFDPSAQLATRHGQYALWLGATETTFIERAVGDGTPTVVRMRFVGADSAVRVEGRERLPGVVHFYRGNDPKRWVRDVPTYSSAARADLYPGITQIYRATEGRWKSEFYVAPGAKPEQILFEYSGLESLDIDAGGALVLSTTTGQWRESAPVVFQEIDGQRRDVAASFRLLGGQRVGFDIGSYDPSHVLLIDPVLTFSTYLGGSGGETGLDIAVDAHGNVVVVGSTSSADFPLLNEVSGTQAGVSDFFVSKFDAAGSLMFSTYLGGTARELAPNVGLDPSGSVYLSGWTTSIDFPTTSGVLGPTPFGVGSTQDDAAVVKLDAAGALIWGTYLGGSSDDEPQDIAVDSDGHAYIMGRSASSDYLITPGAYQTVYQGTWDVFVSKLEPDASALVYSTFLGASRFDSSVALALDSGLNTYVLGTTQSPGFPVTPGVYDSAYDGTDTVFLSKLSADGASLVYSTFLDGIVTESEPHGLDVTVDNVGNAYVVLPSDGTGFPATPGAYDTTFNGGTDVVVMKVDPTASGLVYSTYLGGLAVDEGYGIDIDACGAAIISGYSESSDFPLVDPLAGQTSLNGSRDGIVARLDASGSVLAFSSFLGGSDSDQAFAVALGKNGTCLVGGTSSTDFPVTPGAFQPSFAGGNRDAFVTCLDDPPGIVSCRIFEDLDGDGIQDPGEPGKAGVDVHVTNSQGQIQTVTTDTNGDCSAMVPPGTTTLDIDDSTLPPGSTWTVGTDPTTVEVGPCQTVSVINGCRQGEAFADLAITKTNDRNSVVSGGLVVYTISVTNLGPDDVFGATVSDVFPGLMGVRWSCSATLGSSCTASGSGAINDTVNILAGGTLTYRALGMVDPEAEGSLFNIATVSPPEGAEDPDLSNNTAVDKDPIDSSDEPCDCRSQYTFRRGLMDDFEFPAPSWERAYRSPALDAAFPGVNWKDFDDMTPNRHFGLTLANLPAGIFSAVLEIRMKPHSDNPNNDQLNMVLIGVNEQFGIQISNLPEAHGTWHPNSNSATVFWLDLGTLSSQLGPPPNLLNQVISDRYLDVRAQDDTAVDDVKLHLKFCRPPATFTRRCGLIDNFALPADPISRSMNLDNNYPNAIWRDFDVVDSNAFVGHSLTNLPSDLLGGALDIRMRPHADVPSNDSLKMALVNGSFLFDTRIDQLPESGGMWTNNPPTTFKVQLTQAVIDQMNLDRALDVLVRDDTVVDYMNFRLQSCRLRRVNAWPYEPVGEALLVPTPAGDLAVVGFDDSGDNGLEIDVGESEGYCMRTDEVCVSREGTGLQLATRGRVVNAVQQGFTGSLGFSHNGAAEVDLTAAFSAPFDHIVRVEVLNGGTSVGSRSVLPGAVARVPEDTCFEEFDYVDPCFRVQLTSAVPVTILQGGPTVVGDEIRFCRDIIVGVETVINTFEFTGRNLPDVTVTGGALLMFEQLHQPLGSASFQAASGALAITNLGESGEDGVSIDLGRARSFDLDLSDPDPLETTEPGAWIQVRAVGSLDGNPGQALGELTITDTGAEPEIGRYAFEADLTPIDSPTQRVQIFADGTLIGDFPNQSGIAARASAWPIGLGKLGGEAECYVGRLPPETLFHVDGMPLFGDEIRILSEGSTTVDYKSRFEMLAAGLEELIILDEEMVPEEPEDPIIFSDGFESGDTSAWTGTVD